MHILLDEETRNLLVSQAYREKVSVGQIVRLALSKHFKKVQQGKQKKAVKFIRLLRAHQKKYMGRFEGLDYRALIEDGRRY